MTFDDLEIGEIAMELDDWWPDEVIEWGLETFGDHVAIVTSFQADGLAILDMACKILPEVRVVTVDTWRLPPATLDFVEQVRAHYPHATIDVLEPDQAEVDTMVRRNGLDLFRDSVEKRLLCCQIRKVRPLLRALEGLDAWFTGLRRDQWASRAAIRKVELDHDHDGIVKINPLADWHKDEVWDYLREHDVPVHPLYAQGFTSLGCEPCTRPVASGEDDRAGRWWWEVNAPKECGMHCPIETGGFEHEVHAILGEAHDDL
ncbi:MAG: phosphoadenylyl-sulfate reductase [Nitriliruptorales bacterium]